MAQARPQTRTAPPRPLSPHLQVYSPLINMMMSIVHRITGAALYFGTLLLAWWLIGLASGPEQFAVVNNVMTSPIGIIVLVGYTWAFMHHLLGGLRHLIWDTGRGFELGTVDALCWMSLIGSIALTAVVWLAVLRLKGWL